MYLWNVTLIYLLEKISINDILKAINIMSDEVITII